MFRAERREVSQRGFTSAREPGRPAREQARHVGHHERVIEGVDLEA